MRTINQRFLGLGFQVGIPSQVFIRDISIRTSLVVEGHREKGYSTYRYTFYKITYYPKGSHEKVYMENASPRRVLQRVASFISFLEGVRN
ncbi:hypothetical protein KFZ58_02390 [Virgibacillus sp. NKC19-16]|jgi:hypothetical protein|uniref:hypothetical protein n=1 Tax=Virgibacillus salidurans TaxID=2831673 RepID=UPI001F2033DE|nr:hypothetical protein [Virgibacillus sp. NKC19-16]UJL48145.1 hypothetical protein KFZ58_02390 [Virgibacillus sp. NKC19-16]